MGDDMRVIITSNFEGQPSERVFARGELRKKGGQYLLTYQEPSDDGLIKVSVLLSDSRAVIMRPNARMVLEENESNLCQYKTSAGILDFEFIGKKVSFDLNEAGGKIFLEYEIHNGGSALTSAEIEIKIKE